MHELIERLLDKRGLSLDNLSEEERLQLEKWQATLVKKEVTVTDIVDFCDNQLSFIEKQFDNIENTSQTNDRLVILHSVYRKIRALLSDTSKKQREKLEAELTAMILKG